MHSGIQDVPLPVLIENKCYITGADTGGGKGALDPPSKNFSIPRSRYSSRAVTLIKQS